MSWPSNTRSVGRVAPLKAALVTRRSGDQRGTSMTEFAWILPGQRAKGTVNRGGGRDSQRGQSVRGGGPGGAGQGARAKRGGQMSRQATIEVDPDVPMSPFAALGFTFGNSSSR